VKDLFDFPAAHIGDPTTSHEAAARVTTNGARARHASLVLELVARHPGLTAIELWHRATGSERDQLVEPQEVRRRLTDLLHAGEVRQGSQRRCSVKGSTMVTWEPV
jgi:hypothetical protein